MLEFLSTEFPDLSKPSRAELATVNRRNYKVTEIQDEDIVYDAACRYATRRGDQLKTGAAYRIMQQTYDTVALLDRVNIDKDATRVQEAAQEFVEQQRQELEGLFEPG